MLGLLAAAAMDHEKTNNNPLAAQPSKYLQHPFSQRPLPSGQASATATTAAQEPESVTASSVSHEDEGSLNATDYRREMKHERRRSSRACRRCRRNRCKCEIEDEPPCKGCREAGSPCTFAKRGEPDLDRSHRHPRARKTTDAQANARKAAARKRRLEVASVATQPQDLVMGAPTVDGWDGLPPLGELIEGVNRFTHRYFQLGFIHKTDFPDQLLKDHRSVNLFLLLTILCTSARFTPSLVARYGSKDSATEFFMERASTMAIWEMWKGSNLERCQAYYLLGVAQQGTGAAETSYLNIGIASKMAAVMQLHREETYRTELNNITPPTREMIIRAESARRTMWQLHSQDSLHSGPRSPSSISVGDLWLLLPCSEEDFALGQIPVQRAALPNTPPAKMHPDLISTPYRSLFGTLIQVHYYWGEIRRKAFELSQSRGPFDPESDSWRMMEQLKTWEQALPEDHKFSLETYKKQKKNNQDLAYLSITNITRLCNIVVRRPYLNRIIHILDQPADQHAYLQQISRELFDNVRELYDQIEAQFTNRTPDEGVGAQMTSFSVYSCGLFLIYVCQFPHICQDPRLARRCTSMFTRMGDILSECKEVYPMAARWPESLNNLLIYGTEHEVERTMADGKDPVPRALNSSRKTPPPPPTILPPPRRPLPHAPMSRKEAERRASAISVATGSRVQSNLDTQPSPGQSDGSAKRSPEGTTSPKSSVTSLPQLPPLGVMQPSALQHSSPQGPLQSPAQNYQIQTSLPYHSGPPAHPNQQALTNHNLVSMPPGDQNQPMYMNHESTVQTQSLSRLDNRLNMTISPVETAAPSPYTPQLVGAGPSGYYRGGILPENDGFDENMQAAFGYLDCVPQATFLNGPTPSSGSASGPALGTGPVPEQELPPHPGPGMS